MYSASSTAATRPGVPPTALSSPTRRIWSAIRPPTSTTMLASASRPSSQLPVSSARCSLSHEVVRSRRGAPATTGGSAAGPSIGPGPASWGALCASAKDDADGRVGELQVDHVDGVSAADASRLASARRGPGEAGVHARSHLAAAVRAVTASGYGSMAAVTARPTIRTAWPFERDPVSDAEAERVGEAAFDHHAAVAHPGPVGDLRLVDRCRLTGAPSTSTVARSPCAARRQCAAGTDRCGRPRRARVPA